MIQNVRREDSVTVVELAGRFDMSTAPDIKARLHQIIASGQSLLVIDLRDVNFLDSSALGVLVNCLRRCVAAGGDLCLAEVPEFAHSIFELTRLTRVFKMEQSDAAAVQAMQEDASRKA